MAALDAQQPGRPAPQWTGGAGEDGGADGFMPAAGFLGARPGFAFKLGALGVGYYRVGPAPAAAEGDEEIDIDADADAEPQIEQLKVPSAVFGAAGIGGPAAPMGAMDRLKAKKG